MTDLIKQPVVVHILCALGAEDQTLLVAGMTESELSTRLSAMLRTGLTMIFSECSGHRAGGECSLGTP